MPSAAGAQDRLVGTLRRTRSDTDLQGVGQTLSPAAHYAALISAGLPATDDVSAGLASRQWSRNSIRSARSLSRGLASPPEDLHDDPTDDSPPAKPSSERKSTSASSSARLSSECDFAISLRTLARVHCASDCACDDCLSEPPHTSAEYDFKLLVDAYAPHPYEESRDVSRDEEEEDSPYAEVRATVSNKDDPQALVLTFRTWVLGLGICIVISAINGYLNLRYPAPVITPLMTGVLAYPLGVAMANYLPRRAFSLPLRLQRIGMPQKLSLNPGPFSVKEHAVLIIMANVSTVPSYALSYSVAHAKFYDAARSIRFDIILVLSTQMMGCGLAGLSRRFLVWPASMLWPQNFVYCALLNALHEGSEAPSRGLERSRFFLYAFGAACVWYWLPGFLFTALSMFSWLCWIAPENAVVNQLFGLSTGLGMGFLTFDWCQVAFIQNPLVVPWWAQVNVFVGFLLAFWVCVPILYYCDVWSSAYLPIFSSSVYDRFGEIYNSSRVFATSGFHLNETAYDEYSPLYLSATSASTYGLAFMTCAALIAHTSLYHGPELARRLRRSWASEEADVHTKLMQVYSEVPEWWYCLLLAIALTLGVITVKCWDTEMPVWALFLSIAIAAIYFVPAGYVMAATGNPLTMNVLVEIVAGYALPGLPRVNMLFKVYAVAALGLGLYFTQDLKLGLYAKIPPRVTFTVQIGAVAVTAIVQVVVQRWLISSVPDLCALEQAARLTCPNAHVLHSASLIWGLIGPERLFGKNGLYRPLVYLTLVGGAAPVLTWLLHRRYPQRWFGQIHFPILLTSGLYVPPANGINFSSPLIVGFVMQWFVRKRYFRWWSRYNYILSAALDGGTALGTLIIFLALQLPKNGNITLDWWGNTVYTRVLDWNGASYKTPPPEGFGPTSW
ncbi:hypothetical protein JCM10908_003555 [Rhodotorula pacifica]|uniref:uncharacterized protein n=1 Tax=Rhodotorula pacifica TaxID=1495444 RepID=UPI003170CE6F